MIDIFHSEIIPVRNSLDIGIIELISSKKWDNLFYRGQFDSNDNIRCITPCRTCFQSWFNVSYTDFMHNRIDDLVDNGLISNDLIDEKQIAVRRSLGEKSIYDTILGCTANYVQVKCNNCNTKHLMVLGIAETQPGLYHGQLQGMWRIKK